MRKTLPLAGLVLAITITIAFYQTIKKNTNPQKTIVTDQLIPEKEEEEEGARATDAASAAALEYRMTRDIKTGNIPDGVRTLELEQARSIFLRQSESGRITHHNSFAIQGPDNLGGRTRAVVYDVRFDGAGNQVILAGGVSGGLYKSIDNGATWVRRSPANNLHNVTSIAQDTRAGFEDTWYYATGENLGNSASETGAFYLGHGIFKSTDNGETWTRLAGSNGSSLEGFNARQDLISKVAVDPMTGNVYFAALDAIYRSTNGGVNWSIVLNSGAGSINSGWISDVAITSTGRIYAAFPGVNIAAPRNVPGVWTSITGDPGSWDKIAGDSSLTNPAGWNANATYGRVVLGIAPSSENLVYALYWNGISNTSCAAAVPEAELFRWNQATTTWTNLSGNLPDEAGCLPGNDPFSVQGGYDLLVSVKPDNANVVFIGGTNLYRSTDGFTTNTNTTRIGGYAIPTSAALYVNSHPDIHAVAFQPGNASIMICGNDGGIQRTSNNLAGTVAWTPINSGYNTYQYYYVAVDPRIGNSKVIGGAQDNGTTRNLGGSGTAFEMVLSGDGGAVGLSNDISGNTFEYCATQNGDIYRRNALSAPNLASFIRPATAATAGLFITYFHLDNDNTQTLYYVNSDTVYRNNSASTATPNNWTRMTGVAATVGLGDLVTCLATTRGTYNPATGSLFIGTSDGRILRLDDPQNAAAGTAPTDITNGSVAASAWVSSIAVNPRNDDTVVVTVSNYGTFGIFWTGNANSATPTWRNVEGSLTLPSMRSSAIAITNHAVEYYIGTSAGLFSATIDGTSAGTAAATVWNQEGAAELGNAVITSLALRTSDNTLIAGTHGFGMWRTQLAPANLPVTFNSFYGKVQPTFNELTWEVTDEHNNKGFEVQRKYSGDQNYSIIAFVQGRNTSGINRYSYNDQTIDLGKEIVFYRLRQVDFDNGSDYSSVVPLSRKISDKMVEYMSVSGNNLFVRINNGNNNLNMQLRLFDMNGRLLKNLATRYQSQQIDISGLPVGTYVVEITGRDKQRVTQKIVKR